MKRYLFLIAAFCMLISVKMWAQCPFGDITFITQEDIDEFAVMYPNCTEIEGSLEIGDANYSNSIINNIEPLCQITSVGGHLSFYIGSASSLNSINCFNSIDSIGGGISIFIYNDLLDFTGFSDLNYVGGELYIEIFANSDEPSVFTGFNNLTYIEERLAINSLNLENFTKILKQ